MYYALAVIFPIDRLRALKTLLAKIAKEIQSRGLSERYILDVRLADDMFPFKKQIQIATDNAKAMAARLSGKEVPSFPDVEMTIAHLIERIDKTIAFLESLTEADFDGAEERDKQFATHSHIKGGYLLSYAVPNFMFHITVAYSILRHQGFSIGKSDFLGTAPLMSDTKE